MTKSPSTPGINALPFSAEMALLKSMKMEKGQAYLVWFAKKYADAWYNLENVDADNQERCTTYDP